MTVLIELHIDLGKEHLFLMSIPGDDELGLMLSGVYNLRNTAVYSEQKGFHIDKTKRKKLSNIDEVVEGLEKDLVEAEKDYLFNLAVTPSNLEDVKDSYHEVLLLNELLSKAKLINNILAKSEHSVLFNRS